MKILVTKKFHDKIQRLEDALDAEDVTHDGQKCPDKSGFCDECVDETLAVGARVAELPWCIRAIMWIGSPRAMHELSEDLKQLRDRAA